MPYIEWNELADYTVLDPTWVVEVGERYCSVQIALAQATIDDQLRVRYGSMIPFASPSETLKGWVARVVAFEIIKKRGVEPTDVLYTALRDDAAFAWKQVESAANSDSSRFDLPPPPSQPKARSLRFVTDDYPGQWKERQAERARKARDGI